MNRRRASSPMILFLLLLALTLAALSGLSDVSAQTTQTIRRLDHTTISVPDLETHIRELMTKARVTGMAVSIFNSDQPIYSHSFGYADASKKRLLDSSSEWWACSFSKSVFAYFVMKCVDNGIINLDTPLVHYLHQPLYAYTFKKKSRGYQDIKDDKRFEKITARMCLDHTTGFPNYRGFEPDGRLVIKFDPGTRYSYSGEGIYLLQFVLEQITGRDFEPMVQEEVFRPLGMTHSSYVWQAAWDSNHAVGHDSLEHPYEFDERTVSHAAGSMYTTIGDFSLFYQALLHHQGLSAQSYIQLFRQQVPILSRHQFGPDAQTLDRTPTTTDLFYGLGFGLVITPYGQAFFKEGHSEGWQHYSIAFPREGIAMIIMTNSDQGESIYKDLLKTAIGDVYTPFGWEGY